MSGRRPATEKRAHWAVMLGADVHAMIASLKQLVPEVDSVRRLRYLLLLYLMWHADPASYRMTADELFELERLVAEHVQARALYDLLRYTTIATGSADGAGLDNDNDLRAALEHATEYY